jgi:hypothetical protein
VWSSGFLIFPLCFFQFQFCDIKKIGESFPKISKTSQIYTRKAHICRNFPIFWVKNTTKAVRKKSLAPITTFLVSHGCISLYPKLPIFSLKHKERSKMRFA